MQHLPVGQQDVRYLQIELRFWALHGLQLLLKRLHVAFCLPVRGWMIRRSHLMDDAVHSQELLEGLRRELNTMVTNQHRWYSECSKYLPAHVHGILRCGRLAHLYLRPFAVSVD